MKHLVNVSLLFFFVTLLASGLLRFFQPFSLVVTRVHIIFGFGMSLFVLLHLSSRGKYFQHLLLSMGGKTRTSRNGWFYVGGAFAIWAYALCAALWNFWPAPQLIGVGYEVQHAQEIFRPHRTVASMPIKSGLQVHRGETGETGLRIEFDWGPAFGKATEAFDPGQSPTQFAVWAENEDGTVLETIFVSEQCAGAEAFDWGGHSLRREEILPVWYARYKDLLGKLAESNVDGISSATPTRDFSMDGHLKSDGLPFALYAEVNAPNDTNRFYSSNEQAVSQSRTPPGIGQPSVVYEARIYPSDERQFYLMDLIGHSGGEVPPGDVDYDLGELSTARKLVDKILIRVTWAAPHKADGNAD